MYSQPIFAMADKWFEEKYPGSRFVEESWSVKVPLLPAVSLNAQRLCFRTAYVVATTAVAMAFPYFNQVLGVLGAFNFWPMAIYFPVEMCLRRKSIGAWTANWILLRGFSAVCLVLTAFAFVASVQGIVSARLSPEIWPSSSIFTVTIELLFCT